MCYEYCTLLRSSRFSVAGQKMLSGTRSLKENVESVNFLVDEDKEYKDKSDAILKTSGTEEHE